MPNTRQIRQRIRSVTSTQRITSAMELIAAAKMRRAQQRVLATRPYSTRLLDLIADIVARQSGAGDDIHPLMQVREPSSIGLILFTPDRGLCGRTQRQSEPRSLQFRTGAGTPRLADLRRQEGQRLLLAAGP